MIKFPPKPTWKQKMAANRKQLNLESTTYSEIETKIKSLQKPAACNFILSMVERYIRSLSSPDLVTSSLPSKDELMSLIDTHILRVPPNFGENRSDWPFSVFEELELLELLRGQVEERQLPKDIQLALFDSLFGLGNDNKVVSQHRLSLLEKLVSLAISGLGNGTILHCTSYWIELYPLAAVKLAQDLYSEFCELLPNAMDSIIQLGPNYPSLAKLLTLHLTSCYPIYSVTSHLPLTHKYCPPVQLLHLISQWLVTTPDCLTIFPDTRDVPLLVRSTYIKRVPKVAPLTDVTQWVVLEPLIPNGWIINMTERQDKPSEEDLVREYRTGMSKLHAHLLSYLVSLGNAPVRVAMTGNNLSVLVGRLMEFQQKIPFVADERERRERMELSLNRFAQVLQLGLSVGIINCNSDFLSNVISTLPKNRLLNIVYNAHRTSNGNNNNNNDTTVY